MGAYLSWVNAVKVSWLWRRLGLWSIGTLQRHWEFRSEGGNALPVGKTETAVSQVRQIGRYLGNKCRDVFLMINSGRHTRTEWKQGARMLACDLRSEEVLQSDHQIERCFVHCPVQPQSIKFDFALSSLLSEIEASFRTPRAWYCIPVALPLYFLLNLDFML